MIEIQYQIINPNIGSSMISSQISPRWTKQEEIILKQCLKKFGVGNWTLMEPFLPSKLRK